MKIRYFIIRRLVLMVPTLIGLTLFTFVLLYSLELTHETQLVSQYINPHSKDIAAQLRKAKIALGLNLSFPQQYILFLERLVNGTWGFFPTQFPMFGGLPVLEGIEKSLPNTVQLAFFATLLSVILSIPIGTYIGARPNSVSDNVGRVFSLVGYAFPVFVLGILLQLLFSRAGVVPRLIGVTGLPIGGTMPTFTSPPSWFRAGTTYPTHIPILDGMLNGDFSFSWGAFIYVILPVLTITYGLLAGLLRFIRSGMVDSLSQEYVKTARSKGVPESWVIRTHVRRNAMIPAITVMVLAFATLLGGVVVVEDIFSYHGMGLLALNSVLDFAPYGVLSTTFFFGIIIVIANLVVDVIYALLDPRIRY